MGIYKVQSNGSAPSGLSVGDYVVTGGGTYQINSVKSDGTYNSSLVNANQTTYNYTGDYDTVPPAQVYAQQNSPASDLWGQSATEIEMPKYVAPDTSDLEAQIAELTAQIQNNQYTPVDTTQYTKDIMSYDEAVELARQALEPQYVNTYQAAADAAAQNLDRAGIYNSMYGQAIAQQAQNDVSADMNANISRLALDMQGQERDYAMQLLQAAINENQFGAGYNQQNLSNAAQITLGYLDTLVQQANSINDYNLSQASLQLQRSAQALEEAYARGELSQLELENQLLALEMQGQEIENQIIQQELDSVKVGGGGGGAAPIEGDLTGEDLLDEIWSMSNGNEVVFNDLVFGGYTDGNGNTMAGIYGKDVSPEEWESWKRKKGLIA